MKGIGISEVARPLEEGLQTALRAGNHGGIISEKQAAYNGHQHYAGKIGPAACLSVCHILHRIQIHQGFVEFLLAGGLGGFAVGFGVIHQLLEGEFALFELLAEAGIE